MVELWHPESPGIRVLVKPCLLRRLGIIHSPFATLGEVLAMYRAQRPTPTGATREESEP